MNLTGQIPSNFAAMTSCDMEYLKDHGPAFVASVGKAGNNSHVHTVNPSLSYARLADILNIGFQKLKISEGQRLSLTTSSFDIKGLSSESTRTYYACSRFLAAAELLNHGCGPLFITDIDCLFMDHVDIPDANIGLFLRDPLPGTFGWENEGTRVAAGAVYYAANMELFAREVANTIEQSPLVWFLDQVAISRAYQNFKQYLTIHKYTEDFMDWEFREGTNIWTGKGNRKYDNPIYVGKKDQFTKMFQEALL